jgi:hypothetical protein
MTALPDPSALAAARGQLLQVADALDAGARRTFVTARDDIAAHWSGFAGIEAVAAVEDQRRLVAVVGQAVGDAAAALEPLLGALEDAGAAQAAAGRVADGLGLDLFLSGVDVVELRVGASAPDPQLAAEGVEGIRAALGAARTRVATTDHVCSGRLELLTELANSMVVFPIRPAQGFGPDHFDVPCAPERGLLAAAPTLARLAVPPAPPESDPPLLAMAILDPQAASADLRLPPIARELGGALAVAAASSAGLASAASARRALAIPAADGAPRRLVQWDPHSGHIAEVVGDLEAADRVVVFVPGTGASLDNFSSIADAITVLYDEIRADSSDGRVAVIGWYGSASPPNVAAAALQSYAKTAAPRLAAFVRGLQLAPTTRVTLVGHSYGATVAGLAVHEGLRPAALVGLGAPGFGPKVDSTRDLGEVPTYVLTHPGDPINDVQPLQRGLFDLIGSPLPIFGPLAVDRVSGALGLGHLGVDPTRLPGAIRLSTGDDGAPRPIVATDTSLHVDYFDQGSLSMEQVARIADGDPALPYAP